MTSVSLVRLLSILASTSIPAAQQRSFGSCTLPYVDDAEAAGEHVLRAREVILQQAHQAPGQVLVEEELHAAGGTIMVPRSRSAAKARHARTSSSVSSG